MVRHSSAALALLRDAIHAFIADNALTRGAAISFYAVIAIAPVLFIITAIAALALGQDAASGAIRYQLRRIMSRQSADLVQLAILHARGGQHSLARNIAGAIATVVAASGFFTEIEDALNVIWQAPRTESYWLQLLRGRFMSLLMVIGLGILLTLSMMIASAVGLLANILGRMTEFSQALVWTINMGLSFVVAFCMSAALYKGLPNKPLRWRDVLVGACVTAILFGIGQFVIGFYLANFVSANIYGAAGGLIVLLVWIYYSAQIFLLGAEFTKAWSHRYGQMKALQMKALGP